MSSEQTQSETNDLKALDAEATQLLTEHEESEGQEILLNNEARTTALFEGDHATLKKLDDEGQREHNDIHNLLIDQGANAFNQIKDETGRDIYICSNSQAATWICTPAVDVKNAASGVTAGFLEFGAMSASAGQAIVKYIEVGYDWLLEHAGDITLATVATLLGAAVGSAITGVLAKRSLYLEQVRLAGVARNEAYLALRAAREAGDDKLLSQAIKGLRQARSQVDKVWMQYLPKGGVGTKLANWLSKSPKISGAIGGTLVAIAFTIAAELIINLVNKDLFINLRMYNWTSEQWTVEELYMDNAIICGKKPFEKKVMPAVSHTQHMPWGTALGKWAPATKAEYNFQNSFTLFGGTGFAIKAKTDKTNGALVTLAYYCGFQKHNMIALKGIWPASLESFYSETSNWAPKESKEVLAETLAAEGVKVSLKASTDFLAGGPNGTYNYIVNIGTPRAIA